MERKLKVPDVLGQDVRHTSVMYAYTMDRHDVYYRVSRITCQHQMSPNKVRENLCGHQIATSYTNIKFPRKVTRI